MIPRVARIALWAALLTTACGGKDEGAKFPKCGSGGYDGKYLLPGPAEDGYDEDLALKARRYDRQFRVFNAAPMALSVDATAPVDDEESRALIERFVNEDDGWDFEEFSGGKSIHDVVGGWQKAAGLYAGMGICADAFRYAVLRDQGADCAEIEIARDHLLADMDALHIAFTIGGNPGVVARSLLKKDLPGDAQGIETTPLFDEDGNPLPAEKNNGEWREDQSGLYPDYVWEDSISRDMMLGWAAASAVVMEVTKADPAFPSGKRERIAADSAAVLHELMIVRESGYDLEFPDADGRTTFHGYLNENNLDGNYLKHLENGFYATMALGIVAAYVYASGDKEAEKYLYEKLVKERKLAWLAAEKMKFVDMGEVSNFSNYNMAFTSIWLALRYIKDKEALDDLGKALGAQLYNAPGRGRQPIEMKQSLFDLIYTAGKIGGSAFGAPAGEPDEGAVSRAVETMKEFPVAPFWEVSRANCDEQEIASLQCTGDDGTGIKLLGYVGRNGDLIAEKPIPMRIRPPSNYFWRSNPYMPNGGGSGERLLPGVDFRVAYWLGRRTKVR